MFFPLQQRPRQCHGRGNATSKATPRAPKVGTDRRIGLVLPTQTTATAMPRARAPESGAGPSRRAGGPGGVMSPPSRTLSGAADDHPNPQIQSNPSHIIHMYKTDKLTRWPLVSLRPHPSDLRSSQPTDAMTWRTYFDCYYALELVIGIIRRRYVSPIAFCTRPCRSCVHFIRL